MLAKIKLKNKNLRIISLVTFIVLLFSTSYGQKVRKLRIDFTDKKNTPFSLEQPEEFLSEKAIERRLKYDINLAENDLPINPQYIEAVEELGAVIINSSKWFNFVTVVFPNDTIPSSIDTLSFVRNISHTGFYTIRKNYKLAKDATNYTTYSDIKKHAPEYMHDNNFNNLNTPKNYSYGAASNQIEMLNGHFLHKNGFAGDGMTIAILDGGFYNVNSLKAFDSLWNNSQINGVKDFIDPYSDFYIQSSHGMKVLSTIGANLPGEMVGTAPRANFWLIRTEDASSEYITEEDSWIAGAEFADSAGADIINSSLGYTDFDDPSMNHTYKDMDGNTTRVTKAADIAASKGIIVINSAGNSGNDAWRYIGAPADGDSVFTVGAVDKFKNYAAFSSLGPTYDGRMKPDVTAQGEQTALASTYEGVVYGNGTSYSTPIITGLTACLWQALPELNNMEIINLIKKYSSKYKSPDYAFGYGIPDFARAYTEATHYNVPNFDQENIVNVTPIPFDEELHIKFFSNNTSNINVQIIDVSGRILYRSNNLIKLEGYNSITLGDVGILSQGVYILKIESNGVIYTSKIVKGK